MNDNMSLLLIYHAEKNRPGPGKKVQKRLLQLLLQTGQAAQAFRPRKCPVLHSLRRFLFLRKEVVADLTHQNAST